MCPEYIKKLPDNYNIKIYTICNKNTDKDNITKIILPDFGKNGVNSLPKKEVLNYVEGFLKTF